jgi:hypothetical protein
VRDHAKLLRELPQIYASKGMELMLRRVVEALNEAFRMGQEGHEREVMGSCTPDLEDFEKRLKRLEEDRRFDVPPLSDAKDVRHVASCPYCSSEDASNWAAQYPLAQLLYCQSCDLFLRVAPHYLRAWRS